MLCRAVFVARLALSGPESMPMPNFGSGVLPSAAGAWLMATIAALTAVMLGRAAWQWSRAASCREARGEMVGDVRGERRRGASRAVT